MNGKNIKTIVLITGLILMLLVMVCHHGDIIRDATEIKEMIRGQQAMLFALETLPRQPRANASGQLYLNVPWLKTLTYTLGIAGRITGQTADTTWKTDSTYTIDRKTITAEDTLWDLREK